MTCDSCGASTSNGLALCQACQAWLLVNLEFIPVYFRNLSRWRPSSAGGGRRVRQVAPPMPSSVDATPDRVVRALDECHADLVGWLRVLADDRPQLERVIGRILTFGDERTVRLACALLTKYVATLTTLPWIRDIVIGVATAEKRLRDETERAVPGWYAGACRHCTTPTYVVPGLTWVTCGGCGATTYARDHLEVVLNEAREWVARPLRIAEALVALVDTEQSVPRLHKRISKWGERGRVVAVRRVDDDGDEVGPKSYRFGDVLDALLIEGATRITDPKPKTASKC